MQILRLGLGLLCVVTLGCGGTGGGGGEADAGGSMDGGATVLPDGRVVPTPSDGGGGGGADGGGTGFDGSLVPTGEHCDGPCACSNGVDDDEDGLADADDPECTGPTDDDEATFGTGIPGDNRDGAFQDCFFDGDSGHGNDGCQYRTICLYDETADNCDISDQCRERCLPAVPNGCDCFGCCTVHLPDGTTASVIASSTCSVDRIDDPSACTACVPAEECMNECGECELCPGRTAGDLPPECAETPSCETGTPCAAPEDCGPDEYCSLGCCLAILI